MSESKGDWSVEQSIQTYGIDRWGDGYFGINAEGHLTVKPLHSEGPELDIYHVAQEAVQRNLHFPLLLRFQDILHHRVRCVNEAFCSAMRENNYKGEYRGVFPIKVNQLREVVEEVQSAGAPYHFGLEVGSKPELFAALAIHENPESLLICNGYKDEEFIRIALIGRRLNKKVIMVVEKLEELTRIIAIAKEYNVEPMIGARIRLQTKSAGRWARSSGENSKFGMTTSELLEACAILKSENLAHCLQLIHFHIGSQVPDILTIKGAVREAARFYAKLHKLGFQPQYLDVGGGLGIDYDGSRTSSESSTNYTLNEYTNDVVYNIAEVCNEEAVPHPHLVNEGGRAVVAHHSVLIVEIFGIIDKSDQQFTPAAQEDHKLVKDLSQLIQDLNKRNRRESLHDAIQIRDEAAARFDLGLLDLPTKAKIETNFWMLIEKIVACYEGAKSIPDEVQELTTQLSDQFLCNFSVFQSLIDHWGLGQLFPIMPIHRLNERPNKSAMLVDITCDSDGKIDKFIDTDKANKTLPLHVLNGERYLLGFFLTGAYQDAMGDLHNLFGPVNEAHIFLDDDEPEGFYIEETIQGHSIDRVLGSVQYDHSQLARLMKAQIDQAIKSDRVKPNEGMKLLDYYEFGLKKPTYLSLNR
ncbi:MAG: biosynthetic arginine decarboxylase [Verrucomicrobiota bacterium]